MINTFIICRIITSTKLHFTLQEQLINLFPATSSCGHSISYLITVSDPPAQPDSSDADGESSEENVLVCGHTRTRGQRRNRGRGRGVGRVNIQ